MKRAVVFLCFVLLVLSFVLQLSGCTDEKVLYHNENVVISRIGREITVNDLIDTRIYTLRIRHTRAHTDRKKVFDTSTITLETREGRLVVTDKTDCVIITIRL